MKLFKTKSVLSVFVMIQNNITIIKISTINIVNIDRNAPNVPLYNLKTLKFSPAKSILLQFLSINTKFLIIKFLIQKNDLRKKKEIRKIFYYLIVKFLCSVCEKPVAINHEAVCCHVCNRWVHISCNNICKKTYRGLKKDPTPWFCKYCMQKEIPFSNINDSKYIHLTKDLKVKPKKITKETIFEKLNLFSDNENITCKYYKLSMENGFDKHNNQMTLLHLNILSLPYYIDEFTELLSDLKINFKIIRIVERRLTTKKDSINNINIPGYNPEPAPTKSDKGGAFLSI